ncbi:DUF6516 family protein [candidate division KSB1 bacterium]|nr:DUF6516 family protein [candidate division KSB1 bacterium]
MLTLPEYENFVYSLRAQFESIRASTLIVKRRSPTSAQVIGTIYFDQDVVLHVFETVDFLTRRIEDYGYEVYHGTEKLYWYDCWPHPNDPSLASTFPHHKHISPDIKHHRIPATILSFEEPNLPALIREIEALIQTL